MSEQTAAVRHGAIKGWGYRLGNGSPSGSLRRRIAGITGAHDWPHRWMAVFGTEFCGNWSAPCDNRALRVAYENTAHVYSITEDASTLWIGYPTEWRWFCGRREARRLMWFLLRWWVFGEWFGLRRWLWYKALFAAVRPTRAAAKTP